MAANEGGAGARHRRRATGAVIAGLVALAGCTGDGTSLLAGGDLPGAPEDVEGAEALLMDAVERTTAVESIELSTLFEVGFGAFELDYDWNLAGVGEINGKLRFGGVVEFDMLSDGTTAWLRSEDPEVREHLPAGVDWIEGQHEEILDTTGSAIEPLWALLLYLRGVESIEDGGIGSVDGTPVRLVSGEIDRQAALDEATSDEREQMEDVYSTSSTEERFEFEVGIDGDRRIRSLEYNIEPLDEQALGFGMRVRLDVRRFDHQVEVPEPPPADETVSIDDVPDVVDALGGDEDD